MMLNAGAFEILGGLKFSHARERMKTLNRANLFENSSSDLLEFTLNSPFNLKLRFSTNRILEQFWVISK